ncbi:MAG TPA: TIR domain-containing protein [Pyrinomonadaceae bacterium]|jgi:predicted nucleotide-binding protein
MAKAKILFADNDPAYLEAKKARLEDEGYTIVTAANPQEARRKLREEYFDLAILDVHLEDDKDMKDMSGLDIALETSRSVPKLILTSKPSIEKVMKALNPTSDDLPPASAFVSKREGFDKLLKAVQTICKPKVFIMHGRDEGARSSVARFIEKLGLVPVILNEKPGASRAIIEKFEEYSNVGFAVALLTPDDVGSLKNRIDKLKLRAGQNDVEILKDTINKLKPRARQNVIFELGFFIAKLGRSKVAVLRKEGVEFPSNMLGVDYIILDEAEGWKIKLAQEIENSGIKINFNRAIKD